MLQFLAIFSDILHSNIKKGSNQPPGRRTVGDTYAVLNEFKNTPISYDARPSFRNVHSITYSEDVSLAMKSACQIIFRKWMEHRRFWWSRGKRVGLWNPSSRVQTRLKPSDFSCKKILSTPSFGGEVKPSVPCRKFTACKRTRKWRGSRHFRQNSRQFLAHSSTFRYWGSLVSFQAWRTPGGGIWNVLITVPSGCGFDVPLETAFCKNLPTKNTQR